MLADSGFILKASLVCAAWFLASFTPVSASESDEKNSGHCHRTPEDPVCAQVCKINLADACFCFTLLGETSEIISNFSGNLMGDKFSRLYSFDLGSSFGSSRITCVVKWRQRHKKRHFYLKFNTSSDVKKKLARQKSAAMICIWLPVCAQMRTAHITN